MTVLKKCLVVFLIGFCAVLFAFTGVSLMRDGSISISAEAVDIAPPTDVVVSEYWGNPSTCPNCGGGTSSRDDLTFSKVSGCTFTYNHSYSGVNQCSGTITIHYGVTIPAKEPTCMDYGYSEGVKCGQCGKYMPGRHPQVTSSPLGHDYGEFFTTIEATCEMAGQEQAQCSRCSARQTRTVPALGHSYDNYVYNDDATCTEDGTETGTCIRCEETDTRIKAGTALGHTEGEPVRENEVAATCTVAGSYDEVVYCDRCNKELSRTAKTISALGHSYGAWLVLTNPSCTSSGSRQRTCSRCFDVDTETISALGHSYSSRSYAATCTSQGYTLKSCTRCSYSYKTNYTSALGHNYGSYVTAKSPTCTENGTETATCSRCLGTTSRTVSALGHISVTDPAVAATCTISGLSEGSHCSRCDVVLVEQETVPALGHDEVQHEAKAATCTEKGWKAYVTCSRCDYSTYEEIPAKGHMKGFPLTENEVSASCTVDGSYDTVYYCDVCLEEIRRVESIIPALGHNVVPHVAKSPTCTENGWEAYVTCSRCDYTTYEELPAKGHTAGAAATCTTAQTCTVCGTQLVAALGHDEVQHEAKAPTCTEKGWKAYVTCSRCDYTTYEEIPAKGHTPSAAATCTTAQTCTVCGTELAAALGHDEVQHEAKAPTCTEKGWNAYVTCSRCNYTTYQEVAATGHTEGEPATCITAQTCTVCGTELVPALGHDEILHESKAPTCTKNGWNAYVTCSRCDYTTYEELPAKGHTAGVAATCTTAQTCTVCGMELASALGHDEIQHEAKAATCTENGWNAYVTCSRCDYTTYEELPAKGHKAGAAATCTTAQICTVCGTELAAALGHDEVQHEAKAPTCTEKGWNAYVTCSRCDYTTYEEIPAKGHTPSAAATCTTPQACTVCGTELVPALGHDEIQHEAKAATCTENGWNAYVTCSRCDYTTYEEVAALGHVAGADATCVTPQICTRCQAVLKEVLGHTPGEEATCTKAQICTRCGTQLAEALGHVSVIDEAVAPTCTETGLEAGAHCSRCEQVLLEQIEIPALGHELLPVEDSRTDCTQDGVQTRRCSRCEFVETVEVSGGSHSWRPGKVLRESTCKEVGVQELFCAFCGATSEVEIARKQHKVVLTDEVPATCTTSGLTGGIMCAVCGTELLLRSEIPAIGHSIVFVEEVAATETESGMKAHYFCADCGGLFADAEGDELVSEDELVIPATGDEGPEQPVDPDVPDDEPDGEPDEPSKNEDEELDPFRIILAVVSIVLLVIIISAIILKLRGKKRRR